MASSPDGTEEAGQTVATTNSCRLFWRHYSRGPQTRSYYYYCSSTTAASGAGRTAPSPPKAGSATVASTTGSATPLNGSDDKSSGPPDWEALRAELAKNNPKVKVRQIDNDIDLLNLFLDNQDESKSVVYRASPRKDTGQYENKNNHKRPLFN